MIDGEVNIFIMIYCISREVFLDINPRCNYYFHGILPIFFSLLQVRRWWVFDLWLIVEDEKNISCTRIRNVHSNFHLLKFAFLYTQSRDKQNRMQNEFLVWEIHWKIGFLYFQPNGKYPLKHIAIQNYLWGQKFVF